MRDVKLFKILKTLDKAEFSRLSKFLRSPFFNLSPSFIAYYETIKRYYPTFPAEKIKAEKIWDKVYPKQAFHEVKFWRLSSDFHKLVKRFITALELEKQPKEERKLFIRAMNDRGNYPAFEQESQKLLADWDALPYRDWEYYKDSYQLNFDYYFHALTHKHTLKDEMLEQLMDSIDYQFVFAKYRIGSEMKNRERMLARKYPIRFLEAVAKESRKDFGQENILVQHFQLLFEMYEPEKAAEAFEKLKAKYTEHVQNFRKFDQSLFLTQLINYTIGQINSGQARFYKEALELYQIGLAHELILRNNQLDEAVYGNIVLLGCHAKEFDWTLVFIETYQNYLQEEIREDAVALNKGLWFFHQGDFDKAYDLFYNHSYSHFYELKARFHLIKSLFEKYILDATIYDFLLAQIQAFQKYLYRSKIISAMLREASQNSISVIKKLVNSHYQKKNFTKTKSVLLQEIQGNKIFTGKNWIIEKINSMKE